MKKIYDKVISSIVVSAVLTPNKVNIAICNYKILVSLIVFSNKTSNSNFQSRLISHHSHSRLEFHNISELMKFRSR